MAAFADHFSATATSYSQFRPGYPAELFHYLAGLCPAHERVWDCATGSGQSAQQLTNYFDTVIASDASFEQVHNAQAVEGVFYLNSLAEQTPFRDGSFDLISVAQALHWFELDRFYPEVRRILKPQGLLAVWTYNLMQINPALDRIVWHLYNDVLGNYWPFERRLVENAYRDLYFPFIEKDTPEFVMQSDWSFQHLLGYLSTWSAVKRYRADNQSDPIIAIESQLQSAWGHETHHKVRWPLTVKVASLGECKDYPLSK